MTSWERRRANERVSPQLPFWIALIFGLLGLYILPSVIAAIRGVEGLGWIIVINLLPTGVGWLAALLGALMLPRRDTTQPRSLASHALTRPDCGP